MGTGQHRVDNLGLNSSPLHFSSALTAKALPFLAPDTTDPYLSRLRSAYKLGEVVQGRATDLQRVEALASWVRHRWEHNGDNLPLKSDPISILEEASTGKQFRCTEYAIVLSGVLNAVGIPARVLGLMEADEAKTQYGAGHVVAEAYIADLHIWIMIDGQWNVIPYQRHVPLNAVELQETIATEPSGIVIQSSTGTTREEYLPWIASYLYYFDTLLDRSAHRYANAYDRHSNALVLVPLGAPEPKVFQISNKLNNDMYTNSSADFYPTPARN